jgi:hypothetical protein
MDRTVLYAIKADGYNTRPGYVLDEGQPGTKVRCKVYWTWPGQDDDYLNPLPPLHLEGAKFDIKGAETNGILGPWDEYCATVKAERKAILDKRAAEEQAHKDELDNLVDRAKGLEPLIGGFKGYIELRDLVWAFQSDRAHDTRYSAKHVLLLLEYAAARLADLELRATGWTIDAAADTPVSQEQPKFPLAFEIGERP